MRRVVAREHQCKDLYGWDEHGMRGRLKSDA
jgi:hypothetical protein